MLRIKIHDAYRRIVAVSDPELLGKVFTDGKIQIDVNKDYYGGDEVSEEKADQILRAEKAEDSTFSFVGKNAVKAGIKAGIISNDGKSIITVKGIPHALSLL